MNLIFFAAEKYTSQADNNLSVNIKDEKKTISHHLKRGGTWESIALIR